MNKLILILFLVIGNVLFCQDSTRYDYLNSLDFNPVTPSGKLRFKDGDNDAKYLYGVLEHIFDDNTSYLKYEIINPRVSNLIMNDVGGVIMGDTVVFGEWLKMNGGIKNFEDNYGKKNKNTFKYGTIQNTEYMTVYDKTTNEWIFEIIINYDKFDNPDSPTFINLGSVYLHINK